MLKFKDICRIYWTKRSVDCTPRVDVDVTFDIIIFNITVYVYVTLGQSYHGEITNCPFDKSLTEI